MKKTYQVPNLTFILLADEDVIRTSGKTENPGTVLIPDWN